MGIARWFGQNLGRRQSIITSPEHIARHVIKIFELLKSSGVSPRADLWVIVLLFFTFVHTKVNTTHVMRCIFTATCFNLEWGRHISCSVLHICIGKKPDWCILSLTNCMMSDVGIGNYMVGIYNSLPLCIIEWWSCMYCKKMPTLLPRLATLLHRLRTDRFSWSTGWEPIAFLLHKLKTDRREFAKRFFRGDDLFLSYTSDSTRKQWYILHTRPCIVCTSL